jgi:hypothetical protein
LLILVKTIIILIFHIINIILLWSTQFLTLSNNIFHFVQVFLSFYLTIVNTMLIRIVIINNQYQEEIRAQFLMKQKQTKYLLLIWKVTKNDYQQIIHQEYLIVVELKQIDIKMKCWECLKHKKVLIQIYWI